MESEEKPDLGDNRGPAFASRPHSIVAISGRMASSAAPGVVTHVRRMHDDHLIDRMWRAAQLTDRQHRGCMIMYGLFVRAGLSPDVARWPGYTRDAQEDNIIWAPSASRSPVHLSEGETWLDCYRRIMRDNFKGRAADMVEGMMRGQYPGVKWLAMAQAQAETLADIFGVERNKY